jgi:hypothetical protein
VSILAFRLYTTGAAFVILDVGLAACGANIAALERMAADCCLVVDATIEGEPHSCNQQCILSVYCQALKVPLYTCE